MTINPKVLHDAFFKHQTKPQLTRHGDLYYEGKEFEVTLREKAPGTLTAKLKEALAIPDGAPPPWLINMQRYGPPPAYPNLRLPGLNAPLPAGCRFGFMPGEWGKPPVDEFGRPLYGDVFAQVAADGADGHGVGGGAGDAGVDRSHWAELGSESEEEPGDDDGDEGGGGGGDESDGTASVDLGDLSGGATPSGLASVGGSTTGLSGLDTPDSHVDLRKRAGAETPDSSLAVSTQGALEPPKTLYTVVPESAVGVGAGQFFGAEKRYALPAGGQLQMGAVDAAVLAAAGSAQSAEALLSKQGGVTGDGDDDDEARKRKRKAEKEKEAKKKKYGDFKF
jgi:splicing factor 3B subunit 2